MYARPGIYSNTAAPDSCQNDEYETLTITNIEFYAVDQIETKADDGFTRVGRAESKNPTRRQKHPRATQGPSRDQIFRSLKLQIDIKSKLIY